MSLVTCLYVIGLVFENDLRHNSLGHQRSNEDSLKCKVTVARNNWATNDN